MPPSRFEGDRGLAAVTGATGFIGRHVVSELAARGYRLRVLTRRKPGEGLWPDVAPETVHGDLADGTALQQLVRGATVVVHLAGLIKGRSREHFFSVNREGTGALAAAVRAHAAQAHFLLVSSLAARRPELSDYAASKRAGEDLAVDIIGRPITVLRPPAVYGPGDRETLLFFRLARRRIVPMPGPPSARVAVIHVSDLSRAIADLAAAEPRGSIATALADGRPQGYSWREILLTAGQAVGNPLPTLVAAPGPVLRGLAAIGDVACRLGRASMLTSQKLRELRHTDWAVSNAELVPPQGWQARYDLASGFADAVAWYRRAGWLPPA